MIKYQERRGVEWRRGKDGIKKRIPYKITEEGRKSIRYKDLYNSFWEYLNDTDPPYVTYIWTALMAIFWGLVIYYKGSHSLFHALLGGVIIGGTILGLLYWDYKKGSEVYRKPGWDGSSI